MKIKELIQEGYVAFKLSNSSREQLTSTFPPKYSDFIGHHITHVFGVSDEFLLPKDVEIKVIGYADDGESLEALIVSVNGSVLRPDGKIYHITWSLDRSKGRKPMHSNEVIQQLGYDETKEIKIEAESNFFR